MSSEEFDMGFVSLVKPFGVVIVPFGGSIGTEYYFPSLMPVKKIQSKTTEDLKLIDHPANIGFLIKKIKREDVPLFICRDHDALVWPWAIMGEWDKPIIEDSLFLALRKYDKKLNPN